MSIVMKTGHFMKAKEETVQLSEHFLRKDGFLYLLRHHLSSIFKKLSPTLCVHKRMEHCVIISSNFIDF